MIAGGQEELRQKSKPRVRPVRAALLCYEKEPETGAKEPCRCCHVRVDRRVSLVVLSSLTSRLRLRVCFFHKDGGLLDSR